MPKSTSFSFTGHLDDKELRVCNIQFHVSDLSKAINPARFRDSNWAGLDTAKAFRPTRNSDVPGRLSSAPKLEDVPLEDEPLRNLYTSVVKGSLGAEVAYAPRRRPEHTPTVVIIGAGSSGLSSAFELKRSGLNVVVLESSCRVGGRIKTYGPDTFRAPLHCEGGAMRIPTKSWLTMEYIKLFNLEGRLEKFEQATRVIHMAGLKSPLPYHVFEQKLRDRDEGLLRLFPGLKESEKGKTVDELWNEAIIPVNRIFSRQKDISAAYREVIAKFDKYTLRTYFKEVAGWSEDAVRLYVAGQPIIVLENGFIDHWKDEIQFSGRPGGGEPEIYTLKGGMQCLTEAFLDYETRFGKLREDVIFDARAHRVQYSNDLKSSSRKRVRVHYSGPSGQTRSVDGDFVVFAVPCPTMKSIRVEPAFDTMKVNAVRAARYVDVTKVLLQFRQRWWEKWLVDSRMILPGDSGSKGGGVLTDLPVKYIVFPGHDLNMFKHTKGGVVLAAYNYEQDAHALSSIPAEEAIQTAKDNLAQIVGNSELIESTFERGIVQSWSEQPSGEGSAFLFFGPNQRTTLHDDLCRPQWRIKNLHSDEHVAHFAGEHASLSHGWIQGALESGIRSALSIYKSCSYLQQAP